MPAAVSVLHLTDANFQAEVLDAPTAVLVDVWAEDLEKDKIPARALLKDIQALTAKYQSMSPDELMKLSIDNPVIVTP